MISTTLEKAGFKVVVYSHKPQYKAGRVSAILTTIYAVKDGKTHTVSETHHSSEGVAAKKRLHKELAKI